MKYDKPSIYALRDTIHTICNAGTTAVTGDLGFSCTAGDENVGQACSSYGSGAVGDAPASGLGCVSGSGAVVTGKKFSCNNGYGPYSDNAG